VTGYQQYLDVLEDYYTQHKTQYPHSVITICIEQLIIKIIESKFDEACEIARDRIDVGDSGGYGVPGKSFYELALDYISRISGENRNSNVEKTPVVNSIPPDDNEVSKTPPLKNKEFEQLAGMLAEDEIMCEMYKSSKLPFDQLDYSLDSLKSINLYLDAVRSEMPDDEHVGRVIIRVGAYLGEVIRRNIQKELHWLGFDEAKNISTFLQDQSFNIAYAGVLWLPTKQSFTVPLGKVQKYILNGSEDCTHQFAVTMVEALEKR